MSLAPVPTGPPSNGIQEQQERWERKRARTGRELVRTEQRYCHQLELVNTYFVEILKAKGTLRQDIRESIFSSIKAIHSLNQTLLAYLEDGMFGPGFERFCQHLNHYTVYVDNIHNANKVLQMTLKKNKAFRRFKKLQESRPEFRNTILEDLLPLPLQRIQQYKYFLRDLTENTLPDSPESAALSGAVKAVSEVAQRIQDNARSHENQLQLRRIQKLLTGCKSKVLVPGRWYIREGWLRAVPPKGTEVKPKMFFLFSDVLLLTTPCSPLHPTNGDKFCCQRVYALQDCTVGKVFGHTKSQGGLISLTFTEEKLLLMSSDQEDINDWYRSLSSAVGQLASRTTVVHKRDNLCRRPLRSAQAQSEPSTPSVGPSQPQPVRKRNMVAAETTGQCEGPPHSPRLPPGGGGASAMKKMRLTDAPAESAPESAGSSCVIL
ncbi:rho guanine nucleotide exchange factor 39 [Paramormyrops kingsleyae]|uniref:rho guanine nucleotide exchange factor 39 n=1 Tax=Paramormyrops kingsleyae TaxID=1676925 RepID=UPI003B970062